MVRVLVRWRGSRALLVPASLVAVGLAAPPTPAHAQEAPRTPDAGAAVSFPESPKHDDAMLAPIAPAPQVVGSWEEALSMVRASSTDLHIQLNEIQRAEAATRSALAAALPQANLNASVTHNFITNLSVRQDVSGAFIPGTNVPASDSAVAGLSLSVPVFAMATWHTIGTARKNEQTARLAVQDTKRTLSLGVANALVGAVTAERIAELNRIGLGSALDRLSLARRRAELGGGTQLDVVRAQQDVEATRGTLVTGDESLRQAREALGLAVGVVGQVGVKRELNIDGLEADTRRVCRQETDVMARADLAAQRNRIAVAARNADNVRLQFLPTVNAQSSANTLTPNLGVSPDVTWNIQGVFSWNIWDGGARYGRMRDTDALRSSAEQTLEALRRTASTQIAQAQRGVQVAEASRKVAGSARQLAAEVDRLTRLGFQEGRGTSLELVVAAAALRQADVTLALRDFELVRARVLAILALADCPW